MAQKRNKRGPRGRHWCFTSFLEILPRVYDKHLVRYLCYQSEIAPESKRPHWQGYVELYDDTRLGQLKKILGECHAEIRKGTRSAARQYCLKDETSVPNTRFEFGVWRIQNSRKRKLCDILKSSMSLADIIEDVPHQYVMYHRGLEKLFSLRLAKRAKTFRKVVVTVLVGPTGTGKTRRAIEEDPDDHFVMPASDKLWFDGYNGEKTLIIDDFYGNIKYGFFLRILDGYELQLPIKGGFIWALWTKVIITSNACPDKWYVRGYTPALQRRINHVVHMQDDILDDVITLSFT